MSHDVSLLDQAIERIQSAINGQRLMMDSSGMLLFRVNGMESALEIVRGVKRDHDIRSLEAAGYFPASTSQEAASVY